MINIVEWMELEGERYDWANRSNITMDCPFCGKGKGHFTVSIDKERPFFNCYKCGASGNWVMFVSTLKRIPFSEAQSIVYGSFSLSSGKKEEAQDIAASTIILICERKNPLDWK